MEEGREGFCEKLGDHVDKRFIEESFPVKEISTESANERRIRHGQIASFHLWWTRKPSTPTRATNYASLIPAPTDEIDWVKKRNFIIELSKIENTGNKNILNEAAKNIKKFNDDVPPRVFDPFTGGGTIPLEALKLGCETYGGDYNPVAVLIEKCTLEYPQKYYQTKTTLSEKNYQFLEDIRKWGKWVLKKLDNEIGKFYPSEGNFAPSTYIWTRTIPCQNPSCEAIIPLASNWWLANKENNKIAIMPYKYRNEIKFKIVGQNEKIPNDFDPSQGSINQAFVTCPLCGSSIDPKTTRRLFRKGKTSERIICVVLSNLKRKGKVYRLATIDDLKIFKDSEIYFNEKRRYLFDKWGTDPVPNEFIHTPDNKEYGVEGTLYYNFTPIVLYGMTKWENLFNPRQKLCLITLVDIIKELFGKLEMKYGEDYSKAIISYIALAFDRTLTFSSNLTRWKSDAESPVDIFARQAFPMNFNYAENNPIYSHSGAFIDQVERILYSLEKLYITENPAIIKQLSATNLNYPENYFDAVFTDPPYYDNVPYADLSDFFYVWLKRILGDIMPDLFSQPLTPKKNEVIAEIPLLRGMNKDEASKTIENIKTSSVFEKNLAKSFSEIHRVLKTNGIATIVYAHKTTLGWETVINAILDSGLTVTASWPISTEQTNRLRAKKSAALASSIYIVARKIEKVNIGWFKDIKGEIDIYVPQKLDKLWEEGISGADFFITAIGSAIEIFGKYNKVLDNEGNEIRADKLLSYIRHVVSNYTVRQILHNGIADELSPLTKFYLMWRWNYGEAKVPFDDARKLAQSAGIDLANEWNNGFIIKSGALITVQGPNERDIEKLINSKELIDVMHHICLLWKGGKKDEMKITLQKSGYAEGEALYKVSQAISETLPNNSSEKKMIEGFLVGKGRIKQDMLEEKSQTKLV